MKVEFLFNHHAVEAAQPNVFFAACLRAGPVLPPRKRPHAFCLVIGLQPGADNTRFCETISAAHSLIRHLRREDRVAIIACGESAEMLYPMSHPDDKPVLHALVGELYPSPGSNWRAAADLAAAAFASAPHCEPHIIRIEDALGVDREEFIASKLGQLQPLAARNIRLRIDPLDFCENAEPLGPHRDSAFFLPDGRIEYRLGDLFADEERNACFNLTIPPLPGAPGIPDLTRKVEPYHLACVDNRWYMVGHDLGRHALRTFALARMTRPEVLNAGFTGQRNFRIEEYLRGSFGIFTGEDDFEVVVDFDAWAAALVRERRWHPTQQVQELADGALRLTLRLSNLPEVERWILSWGAHATVVRPDALRQSLRKVAGELAVRYQSAGVMDGARTAPAHPALPLFG